jgi:hypothetical protein
MKLAKLILAIPVVLLLCANSQCTFESDDDDDDDDKPKTQQPQQPQPPQPPMQQQG